MFTAAKQSLSLTVFGHLLWLISQVTFEAAEAFVFLVSAQHKENSLVIIANISAQMQITKNSCLHLNNHWLFISACSNSLISSLHTESLCKSSHAH